MPSSLYIWNKRTPKLDQKYRGSQGSRMYSKSGWYMHSEAPSYAKMALCKLKGALSFIFVKSGDTCTFCHLVPTSCVSFQLALRSSLVLLLFVLFLALCKKSDVTVRKS